MTTHLSKLVAHVCEARAELRAQGASDRVLAEATERLVRDAWAPLVRPEQEWPGWLSAPRCAYCDGTGLTVRRGVTNRLGVVVDEGEPCRCPLGARFLPKLQTEVDHTAAGKTPKPQTKSWARVGR